MKCLSVKNPWALAIFMGKDIENREWCTAYTGPLAIHASASMSKREYAETLEYCKERGVILPTFAEVAALNGCVLGTVRLDGCSSDGYRRSRWFEGTYGWLLTNPFRFTVPIPAKGKLGLWEWESPAEIRERLGR